MAGRREANLSAALATFLEHGVAAAIMDDICAPAGASVGGVYHHFGDKAELGWPPRPHLSLDGNG